MVSSCGVLATSGSGDVMVPARRAEGGDGRLGVDRQLCSCRRLVLGAAVRRDLYGGGADHVASAMPPPFQLRV